MQLGFLNIMDMTCCNSRDQVFPPNNTAVPFCLTISEWSNSSLDGVTPIRNFETSETCSYVQRVWSTRMLLKKKKKKVWLFFSIVRHALFAMKKENKFSNLTVAFFYFT